MHRCLNSGVPNQLSRICEKFSVVHQQIDEWARLDCSGSANTFTGFDPNAPYKISDIFSEFKLDRYDPTDPSRYSACCTDEFCKTQLNSCDSKQPYKFVWGAIPAITSTASNEDCRSLMGCEGSLSMIPTPGSAICSANVYVVQATVSPMLRRLLQFEFRGLTTADLETVANVDRIQTLGGATHPHSRSH